LKNKVKNHQIVLHLKNQKIQQILSSLATATKPK